MKQVLFALALAFAFLSFANANNHQIPVQALPVKKSLEQAQWLELQDGLELIRAITPQGVGLSAYRISPERFEFSIATQLENAGSRARDIGEREGAVLVSNAGFFAEDGSGQLYSVGYLRLAGSVHSKGWKSAGGVISLIDGNITLTPTHAGIPKGDFDALQSRPMLIEPGGKWAMGSNIGSAKLRTLLCTLADGNVILFMIYRGGLTLYEAGWLLRSNKENGYFGCDAAIALDGGRSTQLWHSGEPQYSINGVTPVHSFLVVRQRED